MKIINRQWRSDHLSTFLLRRITLIASPDMTEGPAKATSRRASIVVSALCLGVMGICLWKVLSAAIRIRIEYWDGYDYLNNALLMTGRDLGVTYKIFRPPLVSIINVLPLLFYKPGGAAATIFPHLIAVAFSVLAVVALYRLLRLSFEPMLSLGGALLLVVNPLFLHYSVFTLTDIPGMLFLTAGFYYYAKGNDRLCALTFVFALLTRYSNAISIFSLVLFEVVNGSWRTVLTRRRIKTISLSFLGFYVVHLVIFLLNTKPAWKAPFYILDVFKLQIVASRQEGFNDPILEFPSELVASFSIPIVIMAVAGFVRMWRRKTRTDLVMLCWFAGMFGIMNLATHKEARYLFCVFPPIVYAAVAGFEWLWLILRQRRLTVISVLCAVALIAMPLINAFKELERFNDPAYDGLLMKRVSSEILTNPSPEGRVYWTGLGLYTVYPRQRKVYAGDEFIYFHHINNDALAYWTGKPVEILPEASKFKTGTLISTNNRLYANMPGFEAPEPPPPITIRTVGPAGDNTVEISYR